MIWKPLRPAWVKLTPTAVWASFTTTEAPMSVDDNIGGDVGNKENRSPDKLHVVARFEHED